MFKISFKDTPKYPSKLVTKIGAVTNVILKGTTTLPDFWKHIPADIYEWTINSKYVEWDENFIDDTLVIYAGGKSKCAEGDKFNPILGERLAEARAKYNIYKHFSILAEKLCDYYGAIIYGDGPVIDITNKGLMGVAIKYGKLADREEEHIKKLINSSNYGGT